MITPSSLPTLLRTPAPVLALAPMQEVTDLAFMRILAERQGPDLFYTEYFRVHSTSKLDRHILASITENQTGRPIIAQMIGNDIAGLVRTARDLQKHPVAAIDLNLGCPAPVVYRKCAGGGLLRDPARVDAILQALREAIHIPFTVKTRIGFDDPAIFEQILPLFIRAQVDLVTVHARTVAEGYRSEVHYEYIAHAVEALPCPVLANGNIYSAEKGADVLARTGARGLMIGRGAIRNPWLFHQIRQHLRGEPVTLPTGRDVLGYLHALYDSTNSPEVLERQQVQKMKRYLNFLGLGLEPTGDFLYQVRRVTTHADLFRVCESYLQHDSPLPLEPFPLTLSPQDVLAGEHL
jgi:tRNA-dihydrouridine synthase B